MAASNFLSLCSTLSPPLHPPISSQTLRIKGKEEDPLKGTQSDKDISGTLSYILFFFFFLSPVWEVKKSNLTVHLLPDKPSWIITQKETIINKVLIAKIKKINKIKIKLQHIFVFSICWQLRRRDHLALTVGCVQCSQRERERRDDKCVGLFEKRTEITISIDEEHLHKCRCNQKRRRTLGPSQKAVGGGRQRRSQVSIHTKNESFLSLGSAAVRLRPLSLRRRCEHAHEHHTYVLRALGLWRTALGFIVSKQWMQAKLLLLLYCFTWLALCCRNANRLIPFSIRENTGEKQPTFCMSGLHKGDF